MSSTPQRHPISTVHSTASCLPILKQVRFSIENEFDEVAVTWYSESEVRCITPERNGPGTAHITAANDGMQFSGYPLVYTKVGPAIIHVTIWAFHPTRHHSMWVFHQRRGPVSPTRQCGGHLMSHLSVWSFHQVITVVLPNITALGSLHHVTTIILPDITPHHATRLGRPHLPGSGSFLKFIFDNSNPGCLDCINSADGFGLNPDFIMEKWHVDNATGPYIGGTEVTITAAGLDWDTAGITQHRDLVYAATGQKYNGPVGGAHSIMHATSSSTYRTLIFIELNARV